MLDAFNAVIEQIYSAAAGSARWDEALHAIEDLTGSAGAVVHLIDRHNPADSTMLLSRRIQNHYDAADLEEWARDLMPLCPRLAAGVAHPDAPIVFDYMIMTEAEMDRDPVYDWYRRHGLRYFVGSPLGESQRYKLMWSLQRTPAQGHIEQCDAERFAMIKPHVERAMKLSEELGTLRSYQRFSAAMIDALPQAIFALNRSGRLLFANCAGQSLLARADGVVDVDGHLKVSFAPEQRAIDDLIRRANDPLGRVSAGWTRISKPSGGLPLAVFVSPLVVSEDALLADQAKVLVVAYDTGNMHSVDLPMLKSVYGLTDTESRLSVALCQGHSLESAACEMAITPATARTHLKAIFSKLGVHRQQDLTRLLAFLSTIRPGT